MLVLKARNVHSVLPVAIRTLYNIGIPRDSRNGPVLVSPEPVSTVYERPEEKVVFWPERDYNVAFVIYEALWMLAGRNDLEPLQRYVRTFDTYSDDGKTLHGAYGYRWRKAFGFDQLEVIARRLRENPDDRRCVLQMWDAQRDLGGQGRDLPCNDTVTFQRDLDGRLNMVVFCRSNDIVWGAYYANAFHFALLMEYMANWIGCQLGTYTQVSVNWHGYLETLKPVEQLPKVLEGIWSVPSQPPDPYAEGMVKPARFDVNSETFDAYMRDLLHEADMGFGSRWRYSYADSPFFRHAHTVLKAHELWRMKAAPERFHEAMAVLDGTDSAIDIVQSAARWISKRHAAWERKMGV